MALVFTALADSGCAYLMWAGQQAQWNHISIWKQIDPGQCLAVAMMSIGLYGFGMSLNDIIDRRRDQRISPHRPLASGSIGVAAAHVVCVLLVLMALVGGEIYVSTATATTSRIPLVLVVLTAAMIAFYDFVAKYLVPVGLLTLGMIRCVHAAIPAPHLPVLWHSLLLFNHVTILSTVSYHWEKKRPMLRKKHRRTLLMGIAAVNLVAVAWAIWRWDREGWGSLAIRPGLIGPGLAVVAFCGLAKWIRANNSNPRDAGQNLMLAGMLWLIVYDICFVMGYVGIGAGLLLLPLLPMAYVAVVVMRGWNNLLLLSQRPAFKRIET